MIVLYQQSVMMIRLRFIATLNRWLLA